jgi:hypothetical protein
MPQTPHVEKHFTSSETVRDIVIGMSDGLTVPFALAVSHGLSAQVPPETCRGALHDEPLFVDFWNTMWLLCI